MFMFRLFNQTQNENKFFECRLELIMKKLPEIRQVKVKPIALLVYALCMVFPHNVVLAGERESLEQLRSTTTNLVNLLVQEGVLSKDKADALLKQAALDAQKANEKDATTEPASLTESTDAEIDQKMVRVQYVPDIVKTEMKEEIKKEVMAKLNYKAGARLGMPEWIDNLVWEGSMRLRAQSDKFPDGNPTPFNFNAANGTSLKNTTEDRNRLRLRAQLGVKAEINDWITTGIRVTTGGLNDPISPNQTQEAASSKYTVGLDRAYVSAKIKPWLSVVGGRFANPWFSTDLMWDPDLAFDGIAASFTPKINDKLSSFITAGAFPLEEIEKSSTNESESKWMYGAQAGVKWAFGNKSSATLGIAYYDFKDVEGVSNGSSFGANGPYSDTVPAFRTKGNSVFDINGGQTALGGELYGLSSKFKNINITGQVDLGNFDPVHIILTGDYVKNIGFDEGEIARRTGQASPNEQTDAYQAKLLVGMPNTFKAGEWQTFVAYKRIEADSMLDSFTDSDFYLGGTNAKGWVLGGSYGIDKNAWITARWFSADEISPRKTSITEPALSPLSIDVFMLDLNTKF